MKKKATELFKNNKHWSKEKLITLHNIITGGQVNDQEQSIDNLKDKLEAGLDIDQIFDEEETEYLHREGKFQNF